MDSKIILFVAVCLRYSATCSAKLSDDGCSNDARAIEDCNVAVEEALLNYDLDTTKKSLIDSPLYCQIRFPKGSAIYRVSDYCLINNSDEKLGIITLNFTAVEHACEFDFTSRKLANYTVAKGLRTTVQMSCTKSSNRSNSIQVGVGANTCFSNKTGKFTLGNRYSGVVVRGKVLNNANKSVSLADSDVMNANNFERAHVFCEGDQQLLGTCTCLMKLASFQEAMLRVFTRYMSCHAFPTKSIHLYAC